MGLYGFDKSPISEVLEEFLANAYTTFEKSGGRINVSGTDGWKWHIEYSDPEVNGFAISSSIKGGPERLIVENTFHDSFWWGGLEYILERVTRWPRAIKSGKDADVLSNSKGFERMCKTDKVFARLLQKSKQSKDNDDNSKILGVYSHESENPDSRTWWNWFFTVGVSRTSTKQVWTVCRDHNNG